VALSTHILPGFRTAVVGSGAVGCYYGGRLASHGRDVHFLMRSDLAQVRKRGLRVVSKDGGFHLQGVKAYASTAEIGPCDLVIVALKATANAALESLLPPLLKAGTAILTLENGLGPDEWLAERFGAERVVGGLCFVCLNRTAPGVVEHYAQGQVSIGEFSGYPLPRTHEIASEFKRCGVPCTVVADLARERWKKLVWNVPFNGLSVVCRADTGRILSDPALAALVPGIMGEVVGGSAALGHTLPDGLAGDMIERTRTMGAYKPSSLLDFLAGREVEVEAIWGEPYRRAEAAGAPVGRLEVLYHLVRHTVANRSREA
jgi:2-dehydropantoate 2-reductase